MTEVSGEAWAYRRVTPAGRLCLTAAAADRLGEAGAPTFEEVFARPGAVLDRNRLRDVVRLDDISPPLYRKRFHGVKLRERLRALTRGRWLGNHARVEAAQLAALAARGFRVPTVAGFGEGRGGRALLLLEELPGRPLRACLKDRAAVAAAARLVAALVAAGVTWPDLDARHVFVDAAGTAGLLDVQRIVFRPPGARGRRRMAARLRRSVADLPEGAARLAPVLAALKA